MISRRDILRLGGSAAALALLPRSVAALARPAAAPRLYFDVADLARIRAAAASPLLHPTFDKWSVMGPAATRAAVDKVSETREMIRDFLAAMEALTREGVLHMIDPEPRREALILDGIDALLDLPYWDYFLEVDRPIGIQRASMAVERMLFLREVLGDALGAQREARLLRDVAEKGCAPCALTLAGMEDPSSVRGWRMDDQHAAYMDIDMSRWPVILGANNLRAAPLSALGIGALALRGTDPRADEWLDMAIRNARVVLGFYDPDGGYFEGISYADYTGRSLVAFFDAHQRAMPGVRWADEMNVEGMVRSILTMQAGRNVDGTPDVVNFSDAASSTAFCLPAWFARQMEGTPVAGVAQFAVERVSRPGAFHDFLWVDPDRALTIPPASYLNVRHDSDWVICRTGWAADDAVLAFRSGGPANHEHADRNSFLFKAYGERLLNDHHGAAYDWRQPKWLLRQTEAHNAVLIDGRGHQYHNGEEGTNESLAEARVTRFEDGGERVWFTSDATQAYHLVDPDVALVRRTVAFLKPDILIILDEVRKTATASTVQVRYMPDNRDKAAILDANPRAVAGDPEGAPFVIYRPTAALYGRAAARGSLDLEVTQLALDEEWGVYPYVELRSAPALRHEIVTVVAARPVGSEGPQAARITARAGGGWTVTVDGHHVEIDRVNDAPEVRWA